MLTFAVSLGYRYYVAFNRSGGIKNDFVLLPIFFSTREDAIEFMKDYCKKDTDPMRGWVIGSGKSYTLAYCENLTNSNNIPDVTISVEDMERLRPC